MTHYRVQPDGTYRRWGAADGFLILDCPKCGMPRGQVCRRRNGDPDGTVVLCHDERRAAAVAAGWRAPACDANPKAQLGRRWMDG